jgi:glycosyltransferase involved in cell wall biosynthesis
MLEHRNATLTLLNSVGSLPALQFMPEGGGGKIVLYVHELEQSFERTIGPRVWDRLSPRVDHFISCSDAVRDLLVEQKGVDPARITTHHGFIEQPEAEPLRSAYLRRSLGIPPDAFVIGASGRPDWRKAPEVFVRVARTIARRRRDLDVHFVWLGGPMDGSPGWRLIHDFEEAGLNGRFHLTDESPEPAEIMALFDVCVLTSREDPYPLSMIEAAALGVPIVSFANGGVVDLAAAGGDAPLARVVPYLDVEAMATEVLDLLHDEPARLAMAERARAHVTATHLVEQGAPALFETLVDIAPALRSARRAPTAAPVR